MRSRHASIAFVDFSLRNDVKLADFISQQSALILADWVSFAETCGAAGSAMDLGELRDHAAALLVDIVTDLRTAQTAAEQSAKSKGDAPANTTGEETAAELHGTGRAASGFSMTEMVAEFRALRASVLRLWIADSGTLTGGDLLDLMRFNEAIDQALAESVSRFADVTENTFTRNIWIGNKRIQVDPGYGLYRVDQ